MSKNPKNYEYILTSKIFKYSEQLEKFQWNFLEKMWFVILLKVTKKGFTLSLENTILKKPQWGVKLAASPTDFLGLISLNPLLASPFLIYSHPEPTQSENLFKISSDRPSLSIVRPHPLLKILYYFSFVYLFR